MKRLISFLFLAVVLVASCTGCGNTDSSTTISEAERDIFEDCDMLSLKAEIPSSYPVRAEVCRADFFEPDAEVLENVLMKNEPDQETEDAYGKTVSYRVNEEFLSIYTKLIKGGFMYAGFGDDFPKTSETYALERQLSKQYDLPNYMGVITENELFIPYSEGDLSFMSKENVREKLFGILDSCKLPQLSIRRWFSRDKETLNKNREIYNESRKETERKKAAALGEESIFEPIEYVFTEKDENYQAAFQQIINDIPVTTIGWYQDNLVDEPIITAGEMIWSADRELMQLTFNNLLQVVKSEETVDVCSPREALEVYVKDYNETMHFEETEIINIELNYVALKVKDQGLLLLRPAWIISTLTLKENEYGERMPDYAVKAVDAERKVILQNNYFSEQVMK